MVAIDKNALQYKIHQTTSLPQFRIFKYVLRLFVIDESTRSIDEIVDIIKIDPSLVANILRMANSAYFKRKGNISTLENAVQVIGLTHLKRIVLALCTNSIFFTNKCASFDANAYWQRSMRIAWWCEQIAEATKHNKILSADEYYTIGLLSNIGLLALIDFYPEKMCAILERQVTEEISIELKRVLDIDQYYVSCELFKQWQLPNKYSDIMNEIRIEKNNIDNYDFVVEVLNTANKLTQPNNQFNERDLLALDIDVDTIKSLQVKLHNELKTISCFAPC